MNKYYIEFTGTLTLNMNIPAESLEDALGVARERAKHVDRFLKNNIEWNDGYLNVTGVLES